MPETVTASTAKRIVRAVSAALDEASQNLVQNATGASITLDEVALFYGDEYGTKYSIVYRNLVCLLRLVLGWADPCLPRCFAAF